jgi:hypothetical protein
MNRTIDPAKPLAEIFLVDQLDLADRQTRFDDALELFFGEASDARCRVYARLAEESRTAKAPSPCPLPKGEDFEAASNDPLLAELQLAGTVSGPVCPYAQTLPASFALSDRGPGTALLAEALVCDPCFWTPQLPYLYQVVVELRRGAQVIERAQRPFGIRRLGAQGRNLIFERKRWVLRGIAADELTVADSVENRLGEGDSPVLPRDHPADGARRKTGTVSAGLGIGFDLAEWREASVAMVVKCPDDALCREASQVGVLLVAEISGSIDDLAAQLHRLGRWPAVGIAVIDGMPEPQAALRRAAPNILLAQRFGPGEPVLPAPWAHVALCEVGDALELPAPVADGRGPTIVLRRACPQSNVSQARSLCDRLQRDMASIGDFAGYLV